MISPPLRRQAGDGPCAAGPHRPPSRLRRRAPYRSSFAAWGALLIVAACAPAAPTVPPPGSTSSAAPAPTGPDGDEVASDGKSTITVISRPDHPSVKPPPGLVNAPRTDAECRMQQACASDGLCTAKGTSCVAASYADCEQMGSCVGGKCTFAAGVCSVVASCAASHVCAEDGRCSDGPQRCVADADGCARSKQCQLEGRCDVDDGICVARADASCAATPACSREGRCHANAGRCAATSDQDCKAAPTCQEDKRCLARDGVCVASCAESVLCTENGRCGERASHPGSCVALSDADCDKSAVCRALGHCSVGLDARCEAGDDVECRLSVSCKEDGRCTHRRGRCLPASDAECGAATVACKREGRCKHDAGRCVKG